MAVAGFFICHRGLARKIPQFALGLVSSISLPKPSIRKEVTEELPTSSQING